MKERPRRGMVDTDDWLSSANTLVRTCEKIGMASFSVMSRLRGITARFALPAEAGIQRFQEVTGILDPGFPYRMLRYHRGDDQNSICSQALTLRRLHSLAFGIGTFAYAKDRCHPTIASLEVGYPAFLPHDGLLKDNPPPALISYYCSGGQG